MMPNVPIGENPEMRWTDAVLMPNMVVAVLALYVAPTILTSVFAFAWCIVLCFGWMGVDRAMGDRPQIADHEPRRTPESPPIIGTSDRGYK